MSTKLEYLKKCVQALKPLESTTWYIYCLGIPVTIAQATDSLVHLDPFLKADGMYYLDASTQDVQHVKIVDYTKDEPLFLPTAKLEVDSSWLSSIQAKDTTTVGRLLVNTVGIHATFGDRIAYINRPFAIDTVESIIAARIVKKEDFKDPRTQATVQEYLDCVDRIWFFSKLSKLVSVAASPKIITAPPGIAKLRDKLLKENEGKLNDPLVVASITDSLNNYDKEYLKGDEAARLILAGNKKGNTGRKKMFQIYGDANDFIQTSDALPITTPMDQGLDTDEDILPKYMNDLRLASYSRGKSTALSGYSYKILQRSLSGLQVSDTDCQSKVGLLRSVSNKSHLVNRYVRLANKPSESWTLVNSVEEAGKYLGVALHVRSPMFCKSTDNTICYKCLGELFKGKKNSINNLAAGFSSELMTLFLKRMHTSGFTLVDIDTKDLIT